MSTKSCPFCAEVILSNAVKCRYCGEFLDNKIKQQYTPKIIYWKPGIAALLSLLIPGAGQMYKGKVGLGIAWLFVTIIGYVLFIVPGIILHLICIVTATDGSKYKDYS